MKRLKRHSLGRMEIVYQLSEQVLAVTLYNTNKFHFQNRYDKIPAHRSWKPFAGLGNHWNISAAIAYHSFSTAGSHALCPKFRTTLPMADSSEIPRNLHPQLPRASRHPVTSQNHLRLVGMGHANLLCRIH